LGPYGSVATTKISRCTECASEEHTKRKCPQHLSGGRLYRSPAYIEPGQYIVYMPRNGRDSHPLELTAVSNVRSAAQGFIDEVIIGFEGRGAIDPEPVENANDGTIGLEVRGDGPDGDGPDEASRNMDPAIDPEPVDNANDGRIGLEGDGDGPDEASRNMDPAIDPEPVDNANDGRIGIEGRDADDFDNYSYEPDSDKSEVDTVAIDEVHHRHDDKQILARPTIDWSLEATDSQSAITNTCSLDSLLALFYLLLYNDTGCLFKISDFLRPKDLLAKALSLVDADNPDAARRLVYQSCSFIKTGDLECRTNTVNAWTEVIPLALILLPKTAAYSTSIHSRCSVCGTTQNRGPQDYQQVELTTPFPTNLEEILRKWFDGSVYTTSKCKQSGCTGKLQCQRKLIREPGHLLAISMPKNVVNDENPVLFSQVPDKVNVNFPSNKELRFRGAVLGNDAHFVSMVKFEKCYLLYDGLCTPNYRQFPLDIDDVKAKAIQEGYVLNYVLYEVVDQHTDQSRPSSQAFQFDIMRLFAGKRQCKGCGKYMKEKETCLRMIKVADTKNATHSYFHTKDDQSYCIINGMDRENLVAQEEFCHVKFVQDINVHVDDETDVVDFVIATQKTFHGLKKNVTVERGS
jgi:hypothetical protein